MRCRREFLKQLLAFAFALSVFGQSLVGSTICADHAEHSSYASDKTRVTFIEQKDECCLLDTPRFLPPGRIQKTPSGHVLKSLPHMGIFGLYHSQNLNLIGAALQPASLPPLQGILALRI